MSGRMWIFAGAVLGLSLAVAGLLSQFASSSPDGLERVAMDKGFAQNGEAESLWKWTPFTGYEIPGIANTRFAGASAGVLGTVLVFGVAYAVARLSKANTKRERRTGAACNSAQSSPAVHEVP